MRRRWIWTTFLSAAFVLGSACIMTLAGLMKALSFGMYDGAELEHDLAVWVTWPAFGFAVVMLAVGAWRRRRMDDPRRETFGELGAIALAIFFGGLLSLTRVSGFVWDRPFVAALFLAHAVADARMPRASTRRKVARAAATLAIGLATTWILHHAAY